MGKSLLTNIEDDITLFIIELTQTSGQHRTVWCVFHLYSLSLDIYVFIINILCTRFYIITSDMYINHEQSRIKYKYNIFTLYKNLLQLYTITKN